MTPPIKLEIGKCYRVTKIDGTTIEFNFWGGEPPYGKLLDTDEKIMISVLFDKITSCKKINCP